MGIRLPGLKDSHKVGRLEITQQGQQRADLAVITCLIDQERADEGKYKVYIPEATLLTG